MESRFNATFSVFSYVNACHWKVWQGLFTTVPGTGAQEFNPFVRKKKAILMWKKLSSAKDAPRDRMAKVAAVGRTHTHTHSIVRHLLGPHELWLLCLNTSTHACTGLKRSSPAVHKLCCKHMLPLIKDAARCFVLTGITQTSIVLFFFFVVLILWLWGISSTGLWCIKEGKPRVKSG